MFHEEKSVPLHHYTVLSSKYCSSLNVLFTLYIFFPCWWREFQIMQYEKETFFKSSQYWVASLINQISAISTRQCEGVITAQSLLTKAWFKAPLCQGSDIWEDKKAAWRQIHLLPWHLKMILHTIESSFNIFPEGKWK